MDYRFLRGCARGLIRGLALATAIGLSACGGGNGDDTTTPPPAAAKGTVAGLVLASGTSEPVANATVSVGAASVKTGADGKFTLADVPASERALLRVKADGYVDALVPTPVVKDATRRAVARLLREAAPVTFDAASAGIVTAAGSAARVELPAAGLVNATTGAAATGNVRASVTALDPGADPQTMPGDYTVANGSRIESFGAIRVGLQDAAGNKLQLKTGTTATIRIPVASRAVNPPATIPLYYFDETTGRWIQEGNATLKGQAPSAYYEGQVSHFTTWNADIPQETIYVNGCVATPAGQRIVDARVISEGIDYSGSAFDTTDAEGRFRVAIRKGGRASIWAELDRSSNTVLVGPSQVDITLPNCLVLDATPTPPTIVEPPAPTSATVGQPAFFSVVASGTRPLRYRWQRNGVDIPGATYDYLFFSAVGAGDAGTYRVIVTNAAGTVTSASATLTVNAPTAPTIISQPTSQTVNAGQTASFIAVADGSPTLAYQWLRNGTAIAGATSAIYVTPATTSADNGARFQLRVTNAVGSATSDAAVLTVNTVVMSAPQITTQPADLSAAAGDRATFVVLATGNPAPTYQWQRNGTAIAGATSATYQTPVLTAGDNGAAYSVVVTNSQGSVTSRNAMLTVTNDGSTEQKMALMRLLTLSFEFYEAASLPQQLVDDNGAFRSAAAVCSAGTIAGTFNGGSLPAPGTPMPMSGTLAATAASCVSDDSQYSGTSSIVYSYSAFEPPAGTATATVTNARVRRPATGAPQTDFVANGMASAAFASSVAGGVTTTTVTLAPAAAATLRNELSGLTATFIGGDVAMLIAEDAAERPVRFRWTYNNLRFAVAGVNYQATGFYELSFTGGLPAGGSGEVLLSSGGATIGRIYANAQGVFIEVNGQVQPFGKAMPRRVTR